MTPSTATSARIPAPDVHGVLAEHILADGLRIVLDLEKSRGSRMWDALGEREMLDFFTCYATVPLGYNHPKVDHPDFHRRILPAALNKPSNSDLYTTAMAEFVEAFSRTLPESLGHHLFFIEGGALAVENALKAAFDWKVQKNLAAGRGEKGHRVVHLRQAFHGRSGYTLSLTNTADPRKTRWFPTFDWPRITNPKLRFPVTDQVLEEVARAEAQAIDEVKRALAEHPHEIAALILEPIQGEGGDNHFRREFLEALRDLADEAEFLLVFDEVQTGFGATGRWWCFEHFDVVPDLLAFGKKSQVCGVAAAPRIDQVDSVFRVSSRINSTWGGNLVDMIRCHRYIEIIEEEGLLDHATAIGDHLVRGIHEIADDLPELVSNVRGRGTFVAFDLPSPEVREAAMRAAAEKGVLALRSGPQAMRLRPALNLPREDADEGLARLHRALAGLGS